MRDRLLDDLHRVASLLGRMGRSDQKYLEHQEIVRQARNEIELHGFMLLDELETKAILSYFDELERRGIKDPFLARAVDNLRAFLFSGMDPQF